MYAPEQLEVTLTGTTEKKAGMCMSYFAPEVYDKKYLKPEDQRILSELQSMRDSILNSDVLEDYLDETVDNAPVMRNLVSETLSKFIDYLVLQSEYRFCDFIINRIEDYPEEVYEANVEKAKEKEKSDVQ